MAETAARYGEGMAALWRDPRDPQLDEALNWRQETRPNAAWAALYGGHFEPAMIFLDDSLEARDAEIAEAERQSRRELTLIRRFAATLGLGLVLAVVLSVWAFKQQDEAQRERDNAEAQRLVALQEKTRADSLRNIALTAKDRAEKALAQAEEERLRAEQEGERARREKARGDTQRDIALEEKATAERQKAKADAMQQIAQQEQQKAQEEKATADTLRFRSIARQLAVQALQQEGDLGALLAVEAHRFYTDHGGAAQEASLYKALQATLQRLQGDPVLKGHTSWVRSVAFSPDGRRLAGGTPDRGILLWDTDDFGQQPPSLTGPGETVYAVAFSPDGRRLTAGTPNGILLWDADDFGQPPQSMAGPGETVNAAAFSPDGRWPSVLTASAWPRAARTRPCACGRRQPPRGWPRGFAAGYNAN